MMNSGYLNLKIPRIYTLIIPIFLCGTILLVVILYGGFNKYKEIPKNSKYLIQGKIIS